MTGKPKAEVQGETLAATFRRILRVTREESVRLTRLAKVRAEITGLGKRRVVAIRDLGERTYRLISGGSCSISAVQAMVDEIAALDAAKSEGEDRLRRMQEEHERERREGAGPSPEVG